ncbi:MAG: aldehyde dehydrogenase family protein [Planctomycetaceae bacterium]|nr:aldehyde dehydrogenase family protein [Planctomycetaceae bacterium]
MRNRWLINGAWCDGDTGSTFEVRDPASDAIVATLPRAGATLATAAVDAASRALPAWAALPFDARAEHLRRAADAMTAAQRELAAVVTQECGKPLAEAEGEVRYAADYLRSAAEQSQALQQEVFDARRPGVRAIAVPEPVGVCAMITPWNFPIAMLARKAAPALAAGCTVVAKPAEETPLSALAFAELLQQAGVPAGALNVVAGDAPSIGAAWLADPRVRKLSFTGSTDVGRLLMRGAAEQVIRCSMELGGHAAFIVLEGADVHAAVQGALAAKFRNAGQTCICPNRLLVHRSIAGAFTAQLALAAADLMVGPGTDPATRVGPLINDEAVRKVRNHVADALQRGARLVVGGEPVAPVMAVSSADDAIRIANASPWGLAGYVFGPTAEAERVARQLTCGVVGVNEPAPSNAYAPFGGVKWSGYGREGGHWGIGEYLTTKYLAVREQAGTP